jgi:hypothetical protein
VRGIALFDTSDEMSRLNGIDVSEYTVRTRMERVRKREEASESEKGDNIKRKKGANKKRERNKS